MLFSGYIFHYKIIILIEKVNISLIILIISILVFIEEIFYYFKGV